jgi:hypothetical protein
LCRQSPAEYIKAIAWDASRRRTDRICKVHKKYGGTPLYYYRFLPYIQA